MLNCLFFTSYLSIYLSLVAILIPVFSLLIRLLYLKYGSKNNIQVFLSNDILEKTYLNTRLDTSTANHYTKKLDKLFEETQLYLRSDLSLDLLSEELNIPKHHLSQLFNIHFGKSYYHFIAEHRIAHAVKLLNENVNFTLESLAYECGYNSKTSFNRYFREFIGISPSEYRNNLKTKINAFRI